MKEHFDDEAHGAEAHSQEDLETDLQELVQAISDAVGPANNYKRLGEVTLFRAFEPLKPMHVLCTPLLCVTAQGSKEVTLGQERYLYKPGELFLNSLAVPTESSTLEASPEKPCLWVTVDLPSDLVASVIAEAGLARSVVPSPVKTMETAPIPLSVLKALVRLVRLVETPENATYLAPLILREIIYLLLVGDQGTRLRQIAIVDNPPHSVLRAIGWLHRNYNQPLVIHDLAREAGMSPSSLHQHFKSITDLSPVQYQRQMRLHEAKRLMEKEGLDAANAGYRVGYNDPSYFSREYRRFYGEPPRRHVQSIRNS
jgi:AraC-like DNA-binding protein